MNILGLNITVDRAKASKLKWTRRAAVIAAANAAVLCSGVAFAFWTSSGSGTGTASSGTAQDVTLAGGTVNTNVLYPTGNGDVVVVITNPNPYAVSVDSLALPATAATAYTNSGLTTLNTTCNTNGTGVAWAYATKSLSGVIVAGHNGTTTLTLTSGAAMSNLSDNSCQNSFFKLPNITSAVVTSSTSTPVSSISQ
jgi:hypothetical protein